MARTRRSPRRHRARAPRPAGSGFSASSLQPLQFGVIGGAALAAIGTFLRWVKVSAGGFSQSAGGWNGDLADDLAIGDIVKAGIPIDAIFIVVLGALALYFLLGAMIGLQAPAIPFAVVGLGALIAVVGVCNYIHIKDELDASAARASTHPSAWASTSSSSEARP